MPTLTLRRSPTRATDNCGHPEGMANFGAVHCAATNEVLFDESLGRVLYDDFGDFAVGYVIGRAWAEAVQAALRARCRASHAPSPRTASSGRGSARGSTSTQTGPTTTRPAAPTGR